ncbi:transcription factor bHLH118-like [Bidens hawaiensis]|uniref:transcription factor bHLH118-like n=1 Tax=Bidens hawaiensis TaxID=980011 RepID=UPI0040494CFE
MIYLQQSGEIYHEIPSSSSLRNNQQDLIVNLHDHVNMEGINQNLEPSKTGKRRRDRATTMRNPAEDLKSENMDRKMVHRETEKKRREDISKLYASLGGLLPLNVVKGRRSISDCIQQAVNYIKHMQENIELLSVKRDKIKKMRDKNVKESLLNVVSISSSNGGSFEIQINSCSIEDGFSLSKILKALLDDGLDVINCTSKKINKRLLHSIQSEATDTTFTELSMMQQRLMAIANNRRGFI